MQDARTTDPHAELLLADPWLCGNCQALQPRAAPPLNRAGTPVRTRQQFYIKPVDSKERNVEMLEVFFGMLSIYGLIIGGAQIAHLCTRKRLSH
jgi:hypothetical protein